MHGICKVVVHAFEIVLTVLNILYRDIRMAFRVSKQIGLPCIAEAPQ